MLAFTVMAIKLATPVLVIMFLVEGIKYLKTKNKEKDDHDKWEPL